MEARRQAVDAAIMTMGITFTVCSDGANITAPMQAARQTWRRLERMKLEELAPVVLHGYLDQIQADPCAIHDAVPRQYFDLHQDRASQAQQIVND